MKTVDIMSDDVVCVGPEATLREAIRLMLDNRVSGLPVVGDDGRVVGILTEGDLLHRSETGTERHRHPWLEFLIGPGRAAGDYVKTHGRRVDEIMTREVVSVGPDASLDELVRLLEHRRIKRVPVLADGRLVGIVSRADLMAAVARALDAEEAVATGDDGIRERVLAELAKVPAWAPQSGLTITVKDGIVELNGVIFDEQERKALRVAAENVTGVKGVADRLVWVEPISGTVLDPPDPASGPAQPITR
jgi:CBS domain-containing protein